LTESSFGAAPPWSLGVEEELVLVDAGTLDAVPAFSRVFGDPAEHVKPELFECILELTTPVVEDADAVLASLRRMRSEAAERCDAEGVRLHAAGTHALASGDGQPIVPAPRYEQMVVQLGDAVYRQLVCGLHVHVSVPDGGTCLRAFEGVVPWLPALLALSANSPFAEGQETGRRSERAVRLLEMPSGGTPPVLRTWSDWSEATGHNSTRRHWDAWPRPEYGTLEVRVADQQTDVRRSAGFAALVRALVVTAADAPPRPPYDRELYARRREAATRVPPEPDEVRALAELAEPAGRELGGWELARLVLEGEQEADHQLAAARAGGLGAVVRDVVDRSLP
jgi:glutamate---cysteine ligase / carboxylate-amine ligase